MSMLAQRAGDGVGDVIEPIMSQIGRPLFFIGGTPVTFTSIVAFALILTIAWTVSKVAQRSLRQIYARRQVEEGVQFALNRLLHYGILALAFFLAIDNLGIDIRGMAALGALLGVGIGFGLQNITQNFVSGLILLLERPVKRGDFIVVGDTRGLVKAIQARATLITTLDNVDIVVPNGQLITETVVNQTLGDRRIRIRVEVGVSYGSDVELVRQTLERVGRAHPGALQEPAPIVRFEDFGDSSLDFTLLVWIDNPLEQFRVASDLRFAIVEAFRAAEIEIPFPQRDLHLRSGWPVPSG
jgi:small-conductance mechanosensitive channel